MSEYFVKLALAGETSTKGYRLLKISQPYGATLNDLKHEAIVLYCDTTGVPRDDIESQGAIVTLEFRDHEGDTIIVKTDLDLRNFSASLPSTYIGKVFATVSTPTTKSTTEPVSDAASTSVTTQTEAKVEERNSDNQKILDAVADIFSIAAMSMKAGITAATVAKNVSVGEIKKEAKKAHKVAKEELKAVERAFKEYDKAFHSTRSVKYCDAAVPPMESMNTDDVIEPKLDGCSQTTIDGKDDEKVNDEGTKEENFAANVSSVPFIHGRHTCDQCLTTPIVGARYHALNLPDYDLCASCFGNYKGSEITFEEAQLERDVPYQERWNRKRAMLEGHLKPRMMRRSHYHRRYKLCPAAGSLMTVKMAAPPTVNLVPESVHSTVVAEPPLPPVSNDPEDLALEEAIRRSLSDVTVSNECGDTKASMELETEDVLVENVAEPDIVVAAENLEINCDKESSFATQAVGSGEVAEYVGETLDRMSEAIDQLNNDLMDKGDLIFEVDAAQQNTELEDDSDDDSSGSKIVDGDEDAASTGSWSVVVEKEHMSVEDGGLGRAAEAIGSALFQSDMMRSIEGTSAAVSSVTTVPTFAASIVTDEQPLSPIQLQRWAAQLEQLHELGFTNDIDCIEALELLTAANIGVDSNDEVTVQQVIGKLMGD